jgi:hypothetical protein
MNRGNELADFDSLPLYFSVCRLLPDCGVLG